MIVTMTYYSFLSQEERIKMMAATEFVCLHEDTVVKFDPADGGFWAFSRTMKVKLELSEVRKLPEVRLFKKDLSKFVSK